MQFATVLKHSMSPGMLENYSRHSTITSQVFLSTINKKLELLMGSLTCLSLEVKNPTFWMATLIMQTYYYSHDAKHYDTGKYSIISLIIQQY